MIAVPRVLSSLTPRAAVLWLIALATLASLPNLLYGVSHGMSHLYNISWSQGFTAQLLQGEWYPRWLLDLNNGSGSLAFFIYAPLPFYVTALTGGLCAPCEPTTQLAIGEFVLLLGSACSFYALARRFGPPWCAAVGAFYYMVAPYHFEFDLWSRQAVGEFAAYAFMPLVMLYLLRAQEQPRYLVGAALSYAALVLCHLPAAVLFSFCLPALLWLSVGGWPAWRRATAHLAVAVVLGIGLAGVYLLPALWVQRYDVYNLTFFHYWHHYGNWFLFDNLPEPDLESGNRLTVLMSANLAATGLVALAIWRQGQGAWRTALPWLAGVLLVLFMVTPLSQPVWELLRFLQQVQFPWRIMITADLAVACLIVIALAGAARAADRWQAPLLAMAALVLVVAGVLNWRAFTNFTWFVHYYGTNELQSDAEALKVGTDTPEYSPMWMRFNQDRQVAYAKDRAQAEVIAGQGAVQVTGWAARDIGLVLDLQTAADVQIRQVYVPWWRARSVDGSREYTLTPAPVSGYLILHAPAGRHTLSVSLPPLPIERQGQWLSLAAVALLLLTYLRVRRRPLRHDARSPATS